eukprot:TRINITY_DN869_c0_g1_i2.p2 TRINITY_DN869_c0_g1~~TRINITY_DN869_c0_g1_i2.p2  ORF type:complete len:169 (-),score=55.05 TRINITY_DN869_c0_g1_i2:157-663(-)
MSSSRSLTSSTSSSSTTSSSTSSSTTSSSSSSSSNSMSVNKSQTSSNVGGEEGSYVLRPKFSQKFRASVVKEIISEVLAEKLTGVKYDSDTCTDMTREIADEIKGRLKELDLPRYKFVVQVLIGEQRGEGIKMACRAFWDSDTDNYAQDVFINKHLFCVVAAFGVYLY